MKLHDGARRLIKILSLMTSSSVEHVREIFEALLTTVLLDYTAGESIYLPYLGKITLKYMGDTVTGKYKKAKLEVDFELDDFLIKNIGQIEDHTLCDMEEIYKKKMHENLNKIVSE